MLSQTDTEKLTPMMRQYIEIKSQYPDAVLMYRLGDFYEMFFDDALKVSKLLDLTLTARDCGLATRAPMCGIPYHAAETYVARLVGMGEKVAICDQMEEASAAKGLVARAVTRVITPGTIIENAMLDEGKNNYLASVFFSEKGAGLAFADVTTGTAQVTVFEGESAAKRAGDELCKYMPAEVLVNVAAGMDKRFAAFVQNKVKRMPQVLPEETFSALYAEEAVRRQFTQEALAPLDFTLDIFAVRALGALLQYLTRTLPGGATALREIQVRGDRQVLRIDASTRKNLELCETARTGEKRGSLFWVLDKTTTSMGRRLLRTWIENPLTHLPRISRRQAAVGELAAETDLRLDLREQLTVLHDIERLMSRVMYGGANARELAALGVSFSRLPALKTRLAAVRCDMLHTLAADIDPLADMCYMLETALRESDLPAGVRDGGMIRDGYSTELDELRDIVRGGHGALAAIATAEQEATGIKKLKVAYNRVFGYYIEVGAAYTEKVPAHYVRKQTLSNCERYVTPVLKELEAKVLGAKERIAALEYEIFCQLRDDLALRYARVCKSAAACATLDVLCALAEVAVDNHYCRPEITLGGSISIRDGRHPVVEKMQSGTGFIANDLELDGAACRCVVLTGPNMAGKSTYMRQNALLVIMAQMGSFVPAESATVGLTDAVFTRVGAGDDLSAGTSTFMLEMLEVAQILDNATPQSLLIFDEIGRGTSTYDGMSIARAVLEFAADPKKLGAKTLFATHYHELSALADEIEGVRNFHVAVKRRGDEITFLRRVSPGAADGSFGIEVAKMAGVPESVVRRARAVLRTFAVQGSAGQSVSSVNTEERQQDTSLESLAIAALLKELRQLDVNALTPLEALSLLHSLHQRAVAMPETEGSLASA
jgi:DNA mismatch repair protein MutS